MNIAPRKRVQPSLSQEPLMGTNGEKLLITTLPWKIGTMATSRSGSKAPTVSSVWILAVRRMP